MPEYLEDGSLLCDECVECTEAYGFDVIFNMSCFLHGHRRLIIPPGREEE